MDKRRAGKRIGVLLAATLLLWGFFYYENHHLVVTSYKVACEKLPEPFDGYRIVQLSDLHNAVFGRDNEKLLEKVKGAGPDLIVLTGDIVDSGRTDIRKAEKLCKSLTKICPVYYVTGNHEYWLTKEERDRLLGSLAEAGVHILADETVRLEREQSHIVLLGIDDESLSAGRLSGLAGAFSADEMKVLLAHEPQYIKSYAACGIDVALTGHAHGGQVRLPFLGGVVAPDQGFFPKLTEGVVREGDAAMVISRGLGNSVIPVRLFNDPEIVVIELQKNPRQ